MPQNLYEAAESGNLARVQELLEAPEVNPNEPVGDGGITPLHAAIYGRHADIVTYLVHKGADLKIKTLGGRSALHIAALLGAAEICRYLIEAGADLNAKTEGQVNKTPLDLALQTDHSDVVQLLLERGAGIDFKNASYAVAQSYGGSFPDVAWFIQTFREVLDPNPETRFMERLNLNEIDEIRLGRMVRSLDNLKVARLVRALLYPFLNDSVRLAPRLKLLKEDLEGYDYGKTGKFNVLYKEMTELVKKEGQFNIKPLRETCFFSAQLHIQRARPPVLMEPMIRYLPEHLLHELMDGGVPHEYRLAELEEHMVSNLPQDLQAIAIGRIASYNRPR